MAQELALYIIAELVARIGTKTVDLGKIQLQKMVYFLCELNVPMGYDFQIYHYGPFCSELAEDIDRLDTLGVLSVVPDREGYGYHISIGEYFENMMKEKTLRDDKELSEKIDFVVEKFSHYNPSDIELLATIHFVKKIFLENNKDIDKTHIIGIVYKLKPKFELSYISSKYDEIQSIFKN